MTIDEHVEGIVPLPFRIAETIRQHGYIAAPVASERRPSGGILPDDIQCYILLPRGCLSFRRKPECVGRLTFLQGERQQEGKPATWFLGIFGTAHQNSLYDIGNRLGQAYGVTIKADLIADKPREY
jgi:hypothetical protein